MPWCYMPTVWIVGEKARRRSREIRKSLRRLGLPVFCFSRMEKGIDLLLGDGPPILMLTDPEYAIPPGPQTKIPAIGLAAQGEEAERYADRAVCPECLTEEMLHRLLFPPVRKGGGREGKRTSGGA